MPTTHTYKRTYTAGTTLYAYSQDQSLANWNTGTPPAYMVLGVEGTGANTGRYTFALDSQYGNYWTIFSGTGQPATWATNKIEDINLSLPTSPSATSGGTLILGDNAGGVSITNDSGAALSLSSTSGSHDAVAIAADGTGCGIDITDGQFGIKITGDIAGAQITGPIGMTIGGTSTDGLQISGPTEAIDIDGGVSIANSSGTALALTSSGSNGNGLSLQGHGSGSGMSISGGASAGDGITVTSTGIGFSITANGDGIEIGAGARGIEIGGSSGDIVLVNSSATIPDKLLGYIQLIARSDAAIATDRATELGEINTNEGSGAGDYASATDSLEAAQAGIASVGNVQAYAKDDVIGSRVWTWSKGSSRVLSPTIVKVHPSFDGTLAFDLSNVLNEGASVLTVTSVTVSPSGPTVTGPNDTANPLKSSDGKKVMFDIDGEQADNTDYTFTCTVTTTDSDDALVVTGLMQSRSNS